MPFCLLSLNPISRASWTILFPVSDGSGQMAPFGTLYPGPLPQYVVPVGTFFAGSPGTPANEMIPCHHLLIGGCTPFRRYTGTGIFEEGARTFFRTNR